MTKTVLTVIYVFLLHMVVCFNPFATISSFLPERCNDYWIPNNVTGLSDDLKQNVYGQHLVIKAVINHIRGHINMIKTAEPPKALALSFHGGSGTGKSYVNQKIAEHLYREGMKSKFVHLISATREFNHESRVPVYKDKIQELIENSVYQCPQSLFIFDEMNNMPTGLIDTIAPYLDHNDNIHGINYRKAIFIFNSNTAGHSINSYVIQHWRDGIARENMKLVNLEDVIVSESFNTGSFLWHSDLITRHLITAYIPFLPLERKHVRECIKDSMVSNGYYPNRKFVPPEEIDMVMEELRFYLKPENIFSSGGCKRVAEKVNYVMEE